MNGLVRLLASCALAAACSTAACSDKSERSASSEAAVTGVAIGQIRGVVDISNTLRTRLLDESDPNRDMFDVSRVAGPAFKLRKQLGTFALEGTTTTYQGGLATPLRITLWRQIFSRIGAALGEVCTSNDATVVFHEYAETDDGATTPGGRRFRLDGTFAAKLQAVCAGDRDAAGVFFDAIMGFGSTLAPERAAFLATFTADGAPDATAPGPERVAHMVLAMLLNPHFLLAK